jgi:putative multicomponent Na+:H+ antiporter subunit B
MNDFYLPMIVALLPLMSILLVLQVNPYHALIIRGVLGAVAALVDALLGAADVALTEALVGTMLAITLYAVAVRSSMVLRIGILEDQGTEMDGLLQKLRYVLTKRNLRLEVLSYGDSWALDQALGDHEVHGISIQEKDQYQTQVRIPRIYEILTNELPDLEVVLTSNNAENLGKLEVQH